MKRRALGAAAGAVVCVVVWGAMLGRQTPAAGWIHLLVALGAVLTVVAIVEAEGS